jgi:hypothetical protein
VLQRPGAPKARRLLPPPSHSAGPTCPHPVQAVVQSPLQPLRWLPSGPTKGDAVSSFPIAVQQRVAGGRLAPPSALRSAPSMPCIAECCDGAHEPLRQAGGEYLAPPALCSRPLRSYSEADLQVRAPSPLLGSRRLNACPGAAAAGTTKGPA